MLDQFIRRDLDKGVLRVTMNRPDVLNSCNRQMVRELTDAFESAGQHAEVRAVLLTGTGRAFCAGRWSVR